MRNSGLCLLFVFLPGPDARTMNPLPAPASASTVDAAISAGTSDPKADHCHIYSVVLTGDADWPSLLRAASRRSCTPSRTRW